LAQKVFFGEKRRRAVKESRKDANVGKTANFCAKLFAGSLHPAKEFAWRKKAQHAEPKLCVLCFLEIREVKEEKRFYMNTTPLPQM